MVEVSEILKSVIYSFVLTNQEKESTKSPKQSKERDSAAQRQKPVNGKQKNKKEKVQLAGAPCETKSTQKQQH